MTAKPRIYIDSNPIIDLVKYEVRGNVQNEITEHAWHTQQLIRAAQDGLVDLYTCTLSIAECTHVSDHKKEELARPFFLGLLASGRGGFKLIQPTMVIMELARSLRWVHNCTFKGVDSVHAAAAAHFHCQELLTNDQKMLSNASLLQQTHRLRICRPSGTRLLPDDYRKQSLFTDEDTEATGA
ncbi:type II toxin-antitoxin system VapC family toxin [Holophaga foetida]|uniref:type II toxin-antitoxin system VapC family toxin n=1 Tax=Holophaga foetida TaxID=35839 RepID=UPI0002472A46|nr:PIN domain-containing protein [Holophaga foetida]